VKAVGLIAGLILTLFVLTGLGLIIFLLVTTRTIKSVSGLVDGFLYRPKATFIKLAILLVIAFVLYGLCQQTCQDIKSFAYSQPLIRFFLP